MSQLGYKIVDYAYCSRLGCQSFHISDINIINNHLSDPWDFLLQGPVNY